MNEQQQFLYFKKTIENQNITISSLKNRLEKIETDLVKRESEWMNTTEVCHFLRTTKRTVRSWVTNGKLTPYSFANGALLFKREEVNAKLVHSIQRFEDVADPELKNKLLRYAAIIKEPANQAIKIAGAKKQLKLLLFENNISIEEAKDLL